MWKLKKHIIMRNLYVLLLLIMFFRPTFCQTGNNIVGLYQCVEDEMNLLTREHRYLVKFFEITQIKADSISIWPIVNNSIIAKLKGDSLFFIYDYTDIYNFNTHVEGKGCFFADSINFSYYESQTGYEAFYMIESGRKLPTALTDLASSNRLICFPNPFIDNITLSYEIPNSIKGAAFNLYSVTG